ncbi:MAG: endonuclease/exonuclease/phosphatase family protein [Promethearchaeota archaeon]
MKRNTILAITIFLLPVVLSLGWCALTYQVAPHGTTLKVMTYNIHEGVGVNNRLDLDAILATIQAWDPDVVVLQEVDMGVVLTGWVDQAQWLSLRLNMYLATVSDAESMWQGDVILSKYPFWYFESILLPSAEETDTLLKATISVNSQAVTIFCVHFTVMSPESRLEQANIAFPYIDAVSGLKIWAGDFNIDAYTTNATDQGILASILTRFNDTFDIVPSGNRYGNCTSPSWDPTERIDYIFVSNGIAVNEHRVPASLASDHLPVVATLQVPSSALAPTHRMTVEGAMTLEPIGKKYSV